MKMNTRRSMAILAVLVVACITAASFLVIVPASQHAQPGSLASAPVPKGAVNAPFVGEVTLTATAGTPTGTFSTLKAAFDAINAGTHQGVIAISINADTTEATSAVLNASGLGSASYTSISIQPAGGALRTITGALAAPLIDLNGADNVTIDGLNTGGNALTLKNTSVAATAGTSTVRFILDATSNIIQNTTMLGAESTTTSGTIFFSTGTTTGNDTNIITNNNIGPISGAALPTNAIYASGTTTTLAQNNSNITISNNNIFDFTNLAAADWGINIATGNTDWTISGNSLYQTATRTNTTAATDGGIILSNTSGNNFTISNNFIGGSSASAAGTAWTVAGAIANRFRAISLSVGTTTPTSVQGNTIANFTFTSSSGATATGGPWTAIYLTNGSANIGTTSGNTIGSGTGTGSINLTSTTTGSLFSGIFTDPTTTTTSISNNTIGSILFSTTGTPSQGFHAIATTASSSGSIQ